MGIVEKTAGPACPWRIRSALNRHDSFMIRHRAPQPVHQHLSPVRRTAGAGRPARPGGVSASSERSRATINADHLRGRMGHPLQLRPRAESPCKQKPGKHQHERHQPLGQAHESMDRPDAHVATQFPEQGPGCPHRSTLRSNSKAAATTIARDRTSSCACGSCGTVTALSQPCSRRAIRTRPWHPSMRAPKLEGTVRARCQKREHIKAKAVRNIGGTRRASRMARRRRTGTTTKAPRKKRSKRVTSWTHVAIRGQ